MNVINQGVGVDIENIDRFINYKSSDIFLNKIFTKSELVYCFSKEYPAPHLAVRFAAKEAVIKALCSLSVSTLNFQDIEILNNENGVPAVTFNNGFEQYFVKVSLAHSKDHAIAFVLIMEIEDHG